MARTTSQPPIGADHHQQQDLQGDQHIGDEQVPEVVLCQLPVADQVEPPFSQRVHRRQGQTHRDPQLHQHGAEHARHDDPPPEFRQHGEQGLGENIEGQHRQAAENGEPDQAERCDHRQTQLVGTQLEQVPAMLVPTQHSAVEAGGVHGPQHQQDHHQRRPDGP